MCHDKTLVFATVYSVYVTFVRALQFTSLAAIISAAVYAVVYSVTSVNEPMYSVQCTDSLERVQLAVSDDKMAYVYICTAEQRYNCTIPAQTVA